MSIENKKREKHLTLVCVCVRVCARQKTSYIGVRVCRVRAQVAHDCAAIHRRACLNCRQARTNECRNVKRQGLGIRVQVSGFR